LIPPAQVVREYEGFYFTGHIFYSYYKLQKHGFLQNI